MIDKAFIRALYRFPNPTSTMIELINAVIDSVKESDHLSILDELVKEWEGHPGSDPVTQAVKEGHNRLIAILRSPWHGVKASKNKFDES